MKLNAFQAKVKRWKNNFPKATNRAIRSILKDIRKEVRDAYSGTVVNVRTGRTRRAVRFSYSSSKMQARVFVHKDRAYIANFLENGTPTVRKRPIWGPLKKKYTPAVANKILKEIMKAYSNGG